MGEIFAVILLTWATAKHSRPLRIFPLLLFSTRIYIGKVNYHRWNTRFAERKAQKQRIQVVTSTGKKKVPMFASVVILCCLILKINMKAIQGGHHSPTLHTQRELEFDMTTLLLSYARK